MDKTTNIFNESISVLNNAHLRIWNFDFFANLLQAEGTTEAGENFSLKIENIRKMSFESEFEAVYDFEMRIEEIGKYEQQIHAHPFYICTPAFRFYFDAEKITLNGEELSIGN